MNPSFKKKIFSFFLIFFILIITGFFVLHAINFFTPPRQEKSTWENIPSNPLEKIPDINPIQKSNPFEGVKTNPFE